MRKLFTVAAMALLTISAQAQTSRWSAAYWPGWEIQNGISNEMPPWSAIDWKAFTEIMYFSIVPTTSGDIDTLQNGINTLTGRMLVDSAHAHNVKVILTIGGAGSEAAFMGATSPANLSGFVSKVAGFVNRIGCDGVDIDWEALNDPDSTNFKNLLKDLRAALPNAILTTVAFNPKVDASCLQYLNQVDVCSYDLAGAYPGWLTWYNSCVYMWGPAASNGNESIAAADPEIAQYHNAGIPYSKLSMGDEFGGTIWQGGLVTDSAGITLPGTNGVTAANEGWSSAPPTVHYDVPLYWPDGTGIMQKYYTPSRAHWDNTAQAPYLSLDTTGNANDFFISYEDTNSINAKFYYMKKLGLGGIAFWTLKMGYPDNGTYPALKVIARDMQLLTGVQSRIPPSLPKTPLLEQNYPNPFNPSTTLEFSIPNRSYVRLTIYNVLGQQVAVLADGYMPAGFHTAVWNADRFASGVYFSVLQADGTISSKKMELLK